MCGGCVTLDLMKAGAVVGTLELTCFCAESIAVAVLQQLSNQGDIKKSIVTKAMEKYRIHDVSAADAGNTEGSG